MNKIQSFFSSYFIESKYFVCACNHVNIKFCVVVHYFCCNNMLLQQFDMKTAKEALENDDNCFLFSQEF